MLFIIGIGLCDEQDITVRGLAVVRKCKRIFLEAYTSILLVDKEKLVRANKPIIVSSVLVVCQNLTATMSKCRTKGLTLCFKSWHCSSIRQYYYF